MIDVGRVCVKTAGREAGRFCVVVKKVDDNFVLITGPKKLTKVKRRRCNIEHLEPLEHKISIKADAPDSDVENELKKHKVLEKVEMPAIEVVKAVKVAADAGTIEAEAKEAAAPEKADKLEEKAIESKEVKPAEKPEEKKGIRARFGLHRKKAEKPEHKKEEKKPEHKKEHKHAKKHSEKKPAKKHAEHKHKAAKPKKAHKEHKAKHKAKKSVKKHAAKKKGKGKK